jgi:hypothetical protein
MKEFIAKFGDQVSGVLAGRIPFVSAFARAVAWPRGLTAWYFAGTCEGSRS